MEGGGEGGGVMFMMIMILHNNCFVHHICTDSSLLYHCSFG